MCVCVCVVGRSVTSYCGNLFVLVVKFKVLSFVENDFYSHLITCKQCMRTGPLSPVVWNEARLWAGHMVYVHTPVYVPTSPADKSKAVAHVLCHVQDCMVSVLSV